MANQAETLRFAAIGQDVMIYPQAKIVFPERIEVGNAVRIDDFAFLIGGRSTRIGNFVHISSFCTLFGGGDCLIDDYAGLAAGVRIQTASDDYSGRTMTNITVPEPFRLHHEPSFVTIGKHAAIGANTVILPGVTIGEGAAVGANSLVIKDCEPWTTYLGVPARPLMKRDSARILELQAELEATLFPGGRYLPEAER